MPAARNAGAEAGSTQNAATTVLPAPTWKQQCSARGSNRERGLTCSVRSVPKGTSKPGTWLAVSDLGSHTAAAQPCLRAGNYGQHSGCAATWQHRSRVCAPASTSSTWLVPVQSICAAVLERHTTTKTIFTCTEQRAPGLCSHTTAVQLCLHAHQGKGTAASIQHCSHPA